MPAETGFLFISIVADIRIAQVVFYW